MSNILDTSDAYRRGLRYGDQLLSFAGRPVTTVNGFKNVLGTYPRGWRVPLTFRHEGEARERLRAAGRCPLPRGAAGQDRNSRTGMPPEHPPLPKKRPADEPPKDTDDRRSSPQPRPAAALAVGYTESHRRRCRSTSPS